MSLSEQGQHPWLCISASLLVLMPIVGCTSSSNGSVTGQVSFDGEPLDDAVISFRPIGSGHSGGGHAEIQDGKYKIERMPAGEYSVWVMATRKTGRKVRDPDVKRGDKPVFEEETVQIIPAKYNGQTTLQATVAAGENQHDFELTK